MAEPVELTPGARDPRLPHRARARAWRHGAGLGGDAAEPRSPRRPQGDRRRLTAEPGFEQRFRTEARHGRDASTHDAVLPIYDHGALDDGRLFLAMKLIDGPDLSAVLARARGAPAAGGRHRCCCRSRRRSMPRTSCDLIHRDVKPSNVLLERAQGRLAPVPRGLRARQAARSGASSTRAPATSSGTVDFMAPEQARGDRMIDGRVDVYAFGCLLYTHHHRREPLPARHETRRCSLTSTTLRPCRRGCVPGLPRAGRPCRPARDGEGRRPSRALRRSAHALA